MHLLTTDTPTTPIVSADDLMEHLRLADSIESTYLEALSLSAEVYVEKSTGIGLQPLSRVYIIDTHDVTDGGMQIVPYGPVVMPSEAHGAVVNPITLVAVAVDGTQTSLDVSNGPLTRSRLAMSDCTGSAAFWLLACTAGSETAPEMAKQAIQLIAGGWYERRESVDALSFQEVPMGAKALIHLLADPASRL